MYLSEQLITLIILVTILGSFFLSNLADYLNIKHLKKKLPEEFIDICENEQYIKSQDYLKENTKFQFIISTFDLIILLCFWFAHGFQYLDSIIRSFHFGSIISGLLYIGALLLMKMIISLPFSIYSTFVIEEKYGFNKTTPKLFIIDLIKTIVLSTILGAILISSILAFLEKGGENAWLLCWAASTIFLLIVQYIVPTWIMPLFNKFTPLEEGELRDAITNYADSIDFSLQNVFVMDGSTRSTKSNAFFTGFGKNKRIVLFDTLINDHSVEELLAVLAHEMGHFKKKHILKRLVFGIIQMGVIFYLISIFITLPELFKAFFLEEISIYAGLIFFGMLFSPIDLFISIIMQIFSRKDEYEADRFAADTLKKSSPLISALKKLSIHNLSNLTPHPFYVFLNYSHPPILERIKTLRSL